MKAARTLAGRFARAFGDPLVTDIDGLDALFPTPTRIAALDVPAIASLGIIRSRATAILAIAAAIDAGEMTLDPSADVPTQIARLRALPGIGDWTAQYIAMRALACSSPVTTFSLTSRPRSASSRCAWPPPCATISHP